MFKVGSKVKCISPGSSGRFRLGGIYSVVSIGKGGEYGMFTDDTGTDQRKACDRFISIKDPLPPPKNDIEWLDRVQQNFKD